MATRAVAAAKLMLVASLACMATTLLAQPQTIEPEQASLKDTLTWMAHFSETHGYELGGTDVLQRNTFSARKGCEVTIERFLPIAREGLYIKHSIARVRLNDFAPNSVRLKAREPQSYEVAFERSDGGKVEEHDDMSNGEKWKMYPGSVSLVFDSRESAMRFSVALAHAITLCGGRPSAY